MTIGLISEGKSDLWVLKYLSVGYFEDEPVFREIWPSKDSLSGWEKVFKFCHSGDFKIGLNENDYIVVQIDTDMIDEWKLYFKANKAILELLNQIPKLSDHNSKEIPDAIEKIKSIFRIVIGEDLYDNNLDKIHFAISVNEIECWILVLFYEKNEADTSEHCFKKFNKAAKKTINKEFDPKNKGFDNWIPYKTMIDGFSKEKTLRRNYKKNKSLELFINELSKMH